MSRRALILVAMAGCVHGAAALAAEPATATPAAQAAPAAQATPAQAAPPAQPAASDPASAEAAGAAVFAANCVVCHGAKGQGQPSLAPPLTSYPARYAGIPEGRRQLAMTMLGGMFGGIDVEGHHFDFKMPEFAQLDDAALASVLNFVVFALAQAPAQVPRLTAEEVKAERASPLTGAQVREHRAKVLGLLGL